MSEDRDSLPDLPLERPRDHHYLFAHRVLPGLVFADSSRLAEILVSDLGEAFLFDLWEMIPGQFEIAEILPRAGLSHSVGLANDGRAMITVRLPPPMAATEAHFATVVFSAPNSESLTRYFTLERGFALDEKPRTVLAEWADQGAVHNNYGDGPSPTESDFLEAVLRILGL